jgi:hypothetical protein
VAFVTASKENLPRQIGRIPNIGFFLTLLPHISRSFFSRIWAGVPRTVSQKAIHQAGFHFLLFIPSAGRIDRAVELQPSVSAIFHVESCLSVPIRIFVPAISKTATDLQLALSPLGPLSQSPSRLLQHRRRQILTALPHCAYLSVCRSCCCIE